jgi:hypothetical protein
MLEPICLTAPVSKTYVEKVRLRSKSIVESKSLKE